MNGPKSESPRTVRRAWPAIRVVLGMAAVGILGATSCMKRDPLGEDRARPVQRETETNVAAAEKEGATAETQPLPLFEEVSAEATGVQFVHRLVPDHELAYLYHSGYTCGGVCLGDVTGDGLCDIFLVSGPDENALFVNRGDFVFEKSSASEELAGGSAWGVGASMADVDGDGDLDILVCNYDAPNRLWLNEGTDSAGRPRFTECALRAGLSYVGPSHSPYFADFDGDGDLDLFLLTNRLYSPSGRPSEAASELGPDKQPQVKEEYARYFRVVQPAVEVPADGGSAPGAFLLEYGYPDRVYRNDGPGEGGIPRFQDITASSGVDNVPGHGLSALVWDVNRDGLADVYVANDYTDPDCLWLNLGPGDDGSIRFRNAIDEFVPYTTWSSMGSDVADVDGDGRLDFMVADMAGTTHFKAKSTMGEMSGWRRWVLDNGWPRQSMRNMLFLDSGAGRFREAGYLAGVARSDWTWAVKFADFDLDGRNDLFLSNGSARVFTDSDIIVRPEMMVGRTEWEIFRDKPEMHERNLAFHNDGGLQFADVSQRWNLGKEGMSYGAATGDLDGDGDLDLVVCNLGENVSLYRNRAARNGSHWLRVRLEGAGANRFGMGALVTAHLANGSSLVRLMNPQTGFLSVNEPVLHFGLGDANAVESLEVRWPRGRRQTLGPQRANQLLVVREDTAGGTAPAACDPVESQAPEFAEVAEKVGLRFKHEDRPYDDFRREFLLPGKLSQFGPGVAVADVNGDGLDDVFVGGAAGQAGVLFLHAPDHTFRPVDGMPWEAQAESEDMGALFFDADRDGDLDLYVVHGSNQWDPGDAIYADSLYLNESKPGGPVAFTNAKFGALPDLRNSGSCVVGADFDRDGDVDLFVGSRSIPGQYPLTPQSTLLRNDGQEPGEVKFTDATRALAPDLGQAGLVTGALWSDADGDGWTDLLVTCEWGPVRLFLNHEGRLVEDTARAGLGDRSGWWNAITAGDFDGDGDMDYAALNVGLNTKYGHATVDKPAVLYRGDMDGNGVVDLVEAKASPEGELPVRGRSCSCLAMPALRSKFPTYKEFASASLVGIYTDDTLSSASKVTATEFESGVWINDSAPGEPRFRWQPLPVEAQLSPCYGAVAADFFGDGAPSLVLVQNLYTREAETGLWRGGLGCVLRPFGSDSLFRAMGCDRSGFVVAGDGKGLAIADINADGRPDLVAGQNNDALLAFANDIKAAASGTPQPIAVRLSGPPGNPLGYGARISLVGDDKPLATVEIFGGSGYLSQSATTAFFVRPSDQSSNKIKVVWPSGKESSVPVEPDAKIVTVRME